ncbi:MAG: hypothetical protein U9Q29_08420 [Campylobacterota bacterium]|nr:hypothetical protein [Campylobacterota bacterium]
MNKIVLSALAALTIGTLSATAGDVKFYTDDNGQVFTTAGEGRTELKTKTTPVSAKASKLKFSGKHYLGYTYRDYKDLDDGTKEKSTSGFEARRNYLQVKAYFLEDPKSYFRVTLDALTTHYAADKYEPESAGYHNVYVKYGYLYLNDILPNTGVEIGMAHRPWNDYESSAGWNMRSISKVFTEASEGAHIMNSADLGFNFKTKTDYFTSELGVFNGEGYHADDGDNLSVGMSGEWRLTAAVLGNGKKKRKPSATYLDASFFGIVNQHAGDNGDEDFTMMGAHAVYNMPSFLLSAQYVTSDSDNSNNSSTSSQFNGNGYSVNGTFRLGSKKEFSVFARYDRWEAENEMDNEKYQTDSTIYGVAWQQNKNVKWLVSGQTYDTKDEKNYKGSTTHDWQSAMVTAEVKW